LLTPDVKSQLKKVRVLADLLSLDLPPVSWSLDTYEMSCLEGQVVHSGAETPGDIRAAHDEIEQWARFLGVDVVVRPHTPYETLHLHATAVYRDVKIDVVAIVSDDGGAWWQRIDTAPA
jgi:hypothetical protein